jgi:hypothetical protein
MRALAFASLAILLAGCGGGTGPNGECAVSAQDSFLCNGDKVYLCPAGDPKDAAANEAIDKACEASAGDDTDALAKCMIDAARAGKYKMKPMVLVEDCAASGMTCDIFTNACVAKEK